MIPKIFKQNLVNQAKIIDGKFISGNILQDYKAKIKKLNEDFGVKPGLAIIQIGDRQDSNIYIRNKLKVAKSIGINAQLFKYDSNFEKSKVLDKINELNHDHKVNGIITQLPLENFNKFHYTDFTNQVVPDKDVDCLNYINLNKIFNGVFENNFVPCAAKACLEILDLINQDVIEKQIVIVGASKLVGVPLKHILEFKKSNVILCDEKTKDLKSVCQRADILIVAIGCSKFVSGSFIKQGAVVIDVGINFNDVTRTITGDVNFDEAVLKASYITPVPGGVGPITVAMLMANTYLSTMNSLKQK